jgi:N-acetylgalactosamine-N,N'-diacetylbacillosaminyl-diphospho-undecaprenol 4-alpha-N-acetylgalactosaminyltransferase
VTRTLRAIRADLAISFLIRSNVATAIAARRVGIPSVICERMHLSSHLAENHRGLGLFSARLMSRFAYPLATAAVGVSTGVTRDLIAHAGVRDERAHTIFNCYDLAAVRTAASQQPTLELPPRYVVAVGRLVRNKNFEDLLHAYGSLVDVPPLIILGEGEERAVLEALRDELGLADRVLMPGHVSNPLAVVARADYFVASSLNEGFPNAMAEAMIIGVPVVVTDCLSGPAEILTGDCDIEVDHVLEAEHGILVAPRSVKALAAGMTLMADPARRAHYAGRSAMRAADFAAADIMPSYLRLFAQLLEKA